MAKIEIGHRDGKPVFVSIQGRLPTGPITTAKEALDAFDRMLSAAGAESYAEAQAYRRSGGTFSHAKQIDRAEAYGRVRSAWYEVLREYLVNAAKES